MIDASDPMPNRNIYVHGRRYWVAPNATFDLYPRCGGKVVPLEKIGAELSFIAFEDGTGEGDAHQLDFAMSGRKEARNERVKWIAPFTALRDAGFEDRGAEPVSRSGGCRAFAQINPEDARKQGMAKPVREELQELALATTQLATRNEALRKNDFLEWRITDLGQRTTRLIHGPE
jgi:hypothetical protein